jgi:hypothetical protein
VHFWGLVGSEEDAEHCVSLSNILLASEASKITRT